MRKKPGITARLRAAKARKDKKVADRVRELVYARDGECRFGLNIAPRLRTSCEGVGEWAHFREHKRFKTRGLSPEQRHATFGSLMLCSRHHKDYDEHRLDIRPLTAEGCDGPLKFFEIIERDALHERIAMGLYDEESA